MRERRRGDAAEHRADAAARRPARQDARPREQEAGPRGGEQDVGVDRSGGCRELGLQRDDSRRDDARPARREQLARQQPGEAHGQHEQRAADEAQDEQAREQAAPRERLVRDRLGDVVQRRVLRDRVRPLAVVARRGRQAALDALPLAPLDRVPALARVGHAAQREEAQPLQRLALLGRLAAPPRGGARRLAGLAEVLRVAEVLELVGALERRQRDRPGEGEHGGDAEQRAQLGRDGRERAAGAPGPSAVPRRLLRPVLDDAGRVGRRGRCHRTGCPRGGVVAVAAHGVRQRRDAGWRTSESSGSAPASSARPRPAGPSAVSASCASHPLLEQREPLGEDLGLVGEPRDRDREVQQQHEHEAEARR